MPPEDARLLSNACVDSGAGNTVTLDEDVCSRIEKAVRRALADVLLSDDVRLVSPCCTIVMLAADRGRTRRMISSSKDSIIPRYNSRPKAGCIRLVGYCALHRCRRGRIWARTHGLVEFEVGTTEGICFSHTLTRMCPAACVKRRRETRRKCGRLRRNACRGMLSADEQTVPGGRCSKIAES